MAEGAAVQILDGGLGTSLEDEYGVKFDSSMPLWSSHFLITNPDLLLACQSDFGKAGVDVLLTPTYQVSVEGFARTHVAEAAGIPKAAIGPYLARAVDIAEKAKTRDSVQLALSLGPYGAAMVPGQEYSGKYDEVHDSEEALFAWHLERLRLFVDVEGLLERVRYVAFETLPRLDEIRAVRRAARAAGLSEKQVWVSCVFPGEADALPDGCGIEEAVQALVQTMEDGASLWGIGINCTKIDKLPRLVQKYEAAIASVLATERVPHVPALVLYPDGTDGEVYNTTTQKWEMPKDRACTEQKVESWDARLARIVREVEASGVFRSVLVGGCCKASHRHIRLLKARLEDRGSSAPPQEARLKFRG